MNKSQFRKGFTLVEMLIVIAIIAILASVALVSVRGVRESANDTKRISDLSKIQTLLEVYYNKNNAYPTDASWAALETALSTDGELVAGQTLPNDPTDSATNPYMYGAAANSQSYVLRATLSNKTHSNLEGANELDGADQEGIDCEDASPKGYYCISSF